MNKESKLMRQCQLKASSIGARLFRNNVGFAWSGTPCPSCKLHMRPIKYGLQKGSSDLIGWMPVIILPSMVGSIIAQFYSVEVKDGSRTSKEQVAWLKQVIESFGIGIVAHSTGDIKR